MMSFLYFPFFFLVAILKPAYFVNLNWLFADNICFANEMSHVEDKSLEPVLRAIA
jgi:hypothetical protein